MKGFCWYSSLPPYFCRLYAKFGVFRRKWRSISHTHYTINFTWQNLYCQSQYSKTWDSKCMALIVQMVREFGMNPKVEGSSPPSKSLNHSIIWPRYQWSFDVCKHTAMVKIPRVYTHTHIYIFLISNIFIQSKPFSYTVFPWCLVAKKIFRNRKHIYAHPWI